MHREAVLPRRHQVGFESTQRALIRLAVFVAEFVPARPPTRAQHVESGGLDLCHVAVPHIHVGVIEIEPLHFAGHISSADHGDRLAIDFEEIVIHRQVPAGAQKIGIANPEARTVHVAGFAALEKLGCDDVKAFFLGRGKQQSLWRG